jgi:hypothetical protein
MVNNYVPEEAREITLKTIVLYEKNILKRTPLQDIKKHNYDESLNNSLDMIEKSVYMNSWVNQMKHNIKMKKSLKEAEYSREKFRISKHIDQLEMLSEITNKTEKQKMKQFLLEEQLSELEFELDSLKNDLAIAENYAKDAEEFNKLAYAYYQAIKNKETV